jgi:spermidine synthase
LIQAYAVLEVAIGLYNLLLPLLIKAADPLFGAVYSSGSESLFVLGFTRLAISFSLLIVPATLMGATLPVLVRFYVAKVADAGHEAGRVYAANTLGAAAGAAFAGFVLVPAAGVLFALYFAAALNFAIGAIAWSAGRKHAQTAITAAVVDRVEAAPRILLPAMFLSGLAALMNEVAWTRVLALVVGPTTYAFTLMLCAMIAGLGLGAALGSRFIRRFPIGLSTFAWIQAAIATASLALVPAFGQLPLWIGRLVAGYSGSFAALQVFEFLIFFGLMLAPTTLFGMTFPVAARLYARSDSWLGTEISAIYAFNTVGGIAGSLVAGFLLIPALGSQSTLIVAALISAFLTVAAVYDPRRRAVIDRPYSCWLPVGVGLLVVAAAFFTPKWDPELMASGAYKYAAMYAANSDLESMLTSGDVIFFKEGASTTVSVRKYRGDVMLSVDGKVDATDAGDMTTQKMLAHLPLLLAKDPRNVAIIGLGSGVTAGAALTHPIERLDVVEISPEVVEASQFFSHVNKSALSDPRTRLIVGDGRNHLRYAGQQYDVIISEPSNPWISGMASLFTREFFNEARSRLTPAGIHCQWFHSYNMSVDDLRTVIATFRAEFPSAMLWTLNEYDFLLLGSASTLDIDESVFKRNFERVAGDLAEIKVQDARTVLSLLMLRDQELDRFAGGAILNTDDLPILEFRAPRSIHAETTEHNFAALMSTPRTPFPLAEPTSENHRHKGEMYLAAESFKDAMKEFRAAVALDVNDAAAWNGVVEAARGGDRESVQTLFEDSLRAQPSSVIIKMSAAEFYFRLGNYARTIELLDAVLEQQPDRIEALAKLADALANLNSPRLAAVADRLLKADPYNATGLYHMATIRVYQGRLDEAIQLARRSLERQPKDSRVRNLVAVAYDRTFQPDIAEAEFRRSIQDAPDDSVSYNNYGIFLLGRNRVSDARDQFRRAISLNPDDPQGFVGMGEAFRQAGNREDSEAWYRKALRLDPNHPVAKQFVK